MIKSLTDRHRRFVAEYLVDLNEPVPVQWTPRSTMSVIHGRPVRSLATNREPAVGG
jgi:hypothetical protein